MPGLGIAVSVKNMVSYLLGGNMGLMSINMNTKRIMTFKRLCWVSQKSLNPTYNFDWWVGVMLSQ
jgi:hypothetical protein